MFVYRKIWPENFLRFLHTPFLKFAFLPHYRRVTTITITDATIAMFLSLQSLLLFTICNLQSQLRFRHNALQFFHIKIFFLIACITTSYWLLEIARIYQRRIHNSLKPFKMELVKGSNRYHVSQRPLIL